MKKENGWEEKKSEIVNVEYKRVLTCLHLHLFSFLFIYSFIYLILYSIFVFKVDKPLEIDIEKTLALLFIAFS